MTDAICWFCKRAPPTPGAERAVRLKMVDSFGSPLKTTTVDVPRCAECKTGHGRVTRIGCIAALVGVIGVGLVVFVWNPIEMPTWIKVVLTIFAAAPGGHLMGGARGLRPGQSPEIAAAFYPDVLAAREAGWIVEDPRPEPGGGPRPVPPTPASPPSDELLVEAFDRLQSGDAAGAEKLAAQAVQKDPSGDTYTARSFIRYFAGSVPESLKDYWEAKDRGPRTFETTILLAGLSLLYKQLGVVIANSKVGDKIGLPKDPLTRGAAALVAKRLGEAEPIFHSLLGGEESTADGWLGLVLVKCWGKDFAGALDLAQKAPVKTAALEDVRRALEAYASRRPPRL